MHVMVSCRLLGVAFHQTESAQESGKNLKNLVAEMSTKRKSANGSEDRRLGAVVSFVLAPDVRLDADLLPVGGGPWE
jgi:hypothetical protein